MLFFLKLRNILLISLLPTQRLPVVWHSDDGTTSRKKSLAFTEPLLSGTTDQGSILRVRFPSYFSLWTQLLIVSGEERKKNSTVIVSVFEVLETKALRGIHMTFRQVKQSRFSEFSWNSKSEGFLPS